jgi:hypothetical protein
LLKSARATETGLELSPVVNIICGAKVPLPELRNIPMVFVPELTTTISNKLS